jgi:hypothetical protein
MVFWVGFSGLKSDYRLDIPNHKAIRQSSIRRQN